MKYTSLCVKAHIKRSLTHDKPDRNYLMHEQTYRSPNSLADILLSLDTSEEGTIH